MGTVQKGWVMQMPSPIIKHGGDIVKLTVRRLPESLSGRMCVGVSVYMCV